MAPTALTFDHVPDRVEALLKTHLPTSLPLLRRLQFAKHLGRMSQNARIIFVSELDSVESPAGDPVEFTAAYIDFAGGPETQMWLYSTLENSSSSDDNADEDDKGENNLGQMVYRAQIEVLIDQVVRLAQAYGRPLAYSDGVLLGTLNSRVRKILEGMSRVQGRETGFYDKWLFQGADFPERDGELPAGLRWDTATFDDCKVVVDRTDIPRTPYVK